MFSDGQVDAQVVRLVQQFRNGFPRRVVRAEMGHDDRSTGLFGKADFIEQRRSRSPAFFLVWVRCTCAGDCRATEPTDTPCLRHSVRTSATCRPSRKSNVLGAITSSMRSIPNSRIAATWRAPSRSLWKTAIEIPNRWAISAEVYGRPTGGSALTRVVRNTHGKGCTGQRGTLKKQSAVRQSCHLALPSISLPTPGPNPDLPRCWAA